MNLYESVKSKLREADEHKTFNYNGTECWMEIGSYSASPTVMAIQFMCSEGPYTTATVNLGEDSGNNSVIPFGASFLDTNNNSGIVDFFKKEGLGEVYTRFGEEVTMQSGFCEYPLFQFNVNKLKEYDPKGFAKYESSYRANLEKARSKVLGESSTEDYWDATELDREGFYALLKFNHPEKHLNPSVQYIITNDNNEVYRFSMQGSTEETKDTGAKIEFRKYIDKGE